VAFEETQMANISGRADQQLLRVQPPIAIGANVENVLLARDDVGHVILNIELAFVPV
jgi:hypothetical protein